MGKKTASPNPEARAAMEWVISRDIGISSTAILARLLGGVIPPWDSYPRDPSDLGRCLRLLERIPSWKSRITEMAEVGHIWRVLVREWDALRRSMEMEVGINWEKGRSAPKTYAMMKILEEEGLRSDPNVTLEEDRDGRIYGYTWRPGASP